MLVLNLPFKALMFLTLMRPSLVLFLVLWLKLVKDFLKVRCRLALLPFLISCLIWLDLVASLPLIKERILVIILLLHFLSLMLGSVLVLMLPLLVWLTPDLRIKKSLLKCNWTIRKRLPRCKMRLKKRLLAFSRRLHARIRKTRHMHKMRCLLINRRSLLLALRLLWKTPIFPSNSRFPRLCAKCLVLWLKLVKDFLKVRCRLALLPFLISCLIWLDLVASLPLIKERILVIILLLHFLSLMLGSVLVLMLPLLVWLTPDLRIKKSLLKCNWTIRKRLPRCKMRLKKRLLAFSRRLHARIRKTRYMHKMRCLLINRRSLLLALRLLWKTPIFTSNSRFPRLCAKCLLKLKRLVSILPMTKSKK